MSFAVFFVQFFWNFAFFLYGVGGSDPSTQAPRSFNTLVYTTSCVGGGRSKSPTVCFGVPYPTSCHSTGGACVVTRAPRPSCRTSLAGPRPARISGPCGGSDRGGGRTLPVPALARPSPPNATLYMPPVKQASLFPAFPPQLVWHHTVDSSNIYFPMHP